MLLKTNYTHVISDRKISAPLKKLENPLFIENLRIKKDFKQNVFFKPCKPFDFTESYRINNTEAFVSAALSKKKNLILKDGYKFESENQEDIRYIKKRLSEIEYVTGTSFSTLLLQITSSAIINHNAFVYSFRKEKHSSGEIRKDGRKNIKPIAGFYHLSETKTDLIENNYEAVVGYKYNLKRGIYNEFEKDEISHLTIDKHPDLNLGTPPLEAVKDDILSLRQIEEMLERVIYKLSMPLIHAKVGTDNFPAGIDYGTGKLEVDIVNDQIMHMEDAGGITTSHRVDLKLLGAESLAIRLTPYLDHFKNRVLVGLSTSDVDLGTGTTTTGGAASIVSETLRQNVEMYQNVIETFITDNIITPLLLEAPKHRDKLFLEEEDKVFFKLNKTHLETKIKLESHYINEHNANLITRDEYRAHTGRRQLTTREEEELLKLNGKLPDGSNIPDGLHPDQKAMLKAKSTVTTSSSSSKPAAKQSKGSSNPTSNYTSPTNQHNKSPINDDLNVQRYLYNLKEGREELANSLLSVAIHDSINEYINYSAEDCSNLVRSLTKTLNTYILQNISDYSILTNTVRSVIYKNILDVIGNTE